MVSSPSLGLNVRRCMQVALQQSAAEPKCSVFSQPGTKGASNVTTL